KSRTAVAPASRNDPTSRELAVPVSFIAPTRAPDSTRPRISDVHAVVFPESIAEPTTTIHRGALTSSGAEPSANDRTLAGDRPMNPCASTRSFVGVPTPRFRETTFPHRPEALIMSVEPAPTSAVALRSEVAYRAPGTHTM